MPETRQIRTWLRILICAILCVGATLDDIDYINAIRAPRAMNGSRGSSAADDDSDDQHGHQHFQDARLAECLPLGAPFLTPLSPVLVASTPMLPALRIMVRSGRAPPSFA